MDDISTIDNELVFHYMGFWSRVWASLIDTFCILLITLPLLLSIYGWKYFEVDSTVAGTWEFLLNTVFPMVAIMLFWIYRQATPGKMAISAKIVDAKTGNRPTLKQYVIRYIGYFIATIPLGLGIFWVAWDKRKQGWHDKLAGTVVVCTKNSHRSEHQLNA